MSPMVSLKEDIAYGVDLENDNKQIYSETMGTKSKPSALAFIINPCAGSMLSRALSRDPKRESKPKSKCKGPHNPGLFLP